MDGGVLPCRHFGSKPALLQARQRLRFRPRCSSRQTAAETPSHGPCRASQRLAALVQKAGVSLASLGLAASLLLAPQQPAQAVTNEQLLYLEAWRAVDRAYVDKTFNNHPWFRVREQALKEPMRDREETYAAIRKTLALLDDPFTRFLEPARYAALKRGNSGAVTGVGLEVGFDSSSGAGSSLKVVTPVTGGPADRAGVRPRDAIVAIDDRPTAGMSLYEAGELLQGADGSTVRLKLRPHAGGGEREVTMMRERITFNPVTSQVCSGAGKLGYVRVATFSKQTDAAVAEALAALKSGGVQRVLLDIRNNGGGSFPAGVAVARQLLPGGDVVLIADSDGVRDVISADGGRGVLTKEPLSVLVNRGTASASEVLAGALQDNRRGTVVGERTYGKGLIQTVVELSDGSGVAVTVARYQTPAGTDINKKGITPDMPLDEAALEALPAPGDGAAFCSLANKPDGLPQLFS